MLNNLFRNKSFMLHWLGVAISQTGNFFTVVALPWLVLAMTDNDVLIMTSVLATISLPHGFFILFGGALSDKYSPIKLLLYSRGLLVGILMLLVVVIYFNLLTIPLLYVFAFLLGTLGAMGTPAVQSMLPALVDGNRLAMANGVVMGTIQLAQIVGPLLAGWLIWWVKPVPINDEILVSYQYFSVAFLVDTCAMAISFLILFYIHIPIVTQKNIKIKEMVKIGIIYCWQQKNIRTVLFYLIVISLCLHGPLVVTLPLFSKLVLGITEAGYGTLYAVLGFGTLCGAGISVIISPSSKYLGLVVLLCDFIGGFFFVLLGLSVSVYVAGMCLFCMGLCSGIIMISGMTWFQLHTPAKLMGRVMGVLMFCILGLIPLSASMSGQLLLFNSVGHVMMIFGGAIIFFSSVGLIIPRIRNMGDIKVPIVTVAAG